MKTEMMHCPERDSSEGAGRQPHGRRAAEATRGGKCRALTPGVSALAPVALWLVTLRAGVGTVPVTVGHFPASLAPTHQMPVVPSPQF